MALADLAYPECDYAKTGLTTVVCQLRFNPILKIGQAVPVEFQDRVRQSFPVFVREESIEFRLALGASLPASVESLPPTPATWRFRTEDGAWVAGLAVNFLSLETKDYRHFPDFGERFNVLLAALTDVYEIRDFGRVGLRYVNLFKAEQFPGGWAGRINPSLLGPLADPQLGPEVTGAQQIFALADGDWTIAIRHGLDDAGNYLLDIDHATEAKTGMADVPARLAEFNRRIFQVFRWSITEDMHQQMEPTPRD
ncbi:MAG: TIGR04255 family protein [Chloroflexi bacterium]|nr:TIGR04255 family protein [Chloroflexota bacterium]